MSTGDKRKLGLILTRTSFNLHFTGVSLTGDIEKRGGEGGEGGYEKIRSSVYECFIAMSLRRSFFLFAEKDNILLFALVEEQKVDVQL